MEVSVENAEGLERRLKVQIPAERVEQAVEQKIRRVGQHAKIPGFRPGKVPMKVLYQRYGDGARSEVANEILQSAYPEALEKAKLKPAGSPKVELGDYKAGEALEFTATFDVYPEFELQGLDKLKVERPVSEITEADVDKAVKGLLDQNKSFAEVEREARDGDQAVIDYVGKIDGVAFDGGTGEDIEVDIGEGRFLPDLERALVGRKAGEQYDVTVNFPDDYGSEDLAGKAAQFDVTMKSVKEATLPSLDDTALLEKLGVKEGGEPALREKIKKSLEGEAANAAETRVKTQIMDELHSANPIEVPNSMVGQEIERMRQEAFTRMPPEFREDKEKARELLPDEQLRESAVRRVALGLLLAKVINDKDIKINRERVTEKLDEMASEYGDQAEQIKQYYQSNPQMMQGLEAMVMEGQVVESLLIDANVKDKKMALDDLMNDANESE